MVRAILTSGSMRSLRQKPDRSCATKPGHISCHRQAEEAARSIEEARDYYAKGVEAGELALGPEGFKEYAGHFWGFLQTRPYMRARAGLAAALMKLGDVESAVAHYRDMLRLNPNDNQGIRYLLAAHLLRQGDEAALKELLTSYEDEGSATWLYTQALLAFRQDGASPQAVKLVKEALASNEHVPAILEHFRPTWTHMKPHALGSAALTGST